MYDPCMIVKAKDFPQINSSCALLYKPFQPCLLKLLGEGNKLCSYYKQLLLQDIVAQRIDRYLDRWVDGREGGREGKGRKERSEKATLLYKRIPNTSCRHSPLQEIEINPLPTLFF